VNFRRIIEIPDFGPLSQLLIEFYCSRRLPQKGFGWNYWNRLLLPTMPLRPTPVVEKTTLPMSFKVCVDCGLLWILAQEVCSVR